MTKLRYYLLLDHIQIQGANAISSPLTYGFPSIGGFLGAVHALSRQIESDKEIYLDGVMIACHQCDLQIYRPHDFADYTFKLTRNPIGKDGKARSIIEEGKVHLDVSLVIEVVCERDALDTEEEREAFKEQIQQKILQQRIAGGSVFNVKEVQLYNYDDNTDILVSYLSPAFVLIDAQADLLEITQELQQHDPDATMLDALIATAKLWHKPEGKNKWQATSIKTGRGWLVPIHLGYQGISPLLPAESVEHCRSNQRPVQFVECIYGLGKWVFPYRITDQFAESFWRYDSVIKQSNGADLYLITQKVTEY